MSKLETVEKKELTNILLLVMLVKLIISYPRKIVEVAGNSAWIVSIYVTVIMLLIYYVITKVYDFSRPVLEKAELNGGKTVKFIVGIIVFVSLLLTMTSITRLYPESVKIILLPKTPIEVIIMLFSAAAIAAVYCGISAIGRVVAIFLPIAGIIMGICILLLVPHMDISNITPLFGTGYKRIFVNGLEFLSSFSDLLVLFLINIKSGDRKYAAKCGYKAIIITGTVMTVIIFAYCAVFPYDVSQFFLMPYYQMTRVAQIGEVLTRVEALFEFVWTIVVMLYFSVYLYVLCNIWSDMFNLKYYKPLALPIMISVAYLALIPPIYLEFDDNFVWYSILLVSVSVLIPITTGILERVKKKDKNI